MHSFLHGITALLHGKEAGSRREAAGEQVVTSKNAWFLYGITTSAARGAGVRVPGKPEAA